MNILITGGSGLIGSRLIHLLLKNKKYKILATYNKTKIRLKNSRLKTIKHNGNLSQIKKLLKKQDIIIHTTSIDKKLSTKNPKLALKINLEYTKKLFIEASKQKIKKFIYFSTAQVYGSNLKGIINEEHKTYCANNIYAKSHLLSEKEILNYKKKFQKKILIFIIRLSNSFGKPANNGPRIWNPIINEFFFEALNKGKITIKKPYLVRNFVSLISVEKLISFFLKKDNKNDILCNFGGNTFSLLKIARLIKNKFVIIFGKKIDIIFNEKNKKKPNKLKYKSKYNYINKISIYKDFNKEILNLLKYKR